MLKWIIHSGLRKFSKRYNYDNQYMHRLVDTSTSVGLGIAFLPLLSQYRGPKEAGDIWQVQCWHLLWMVAVANVRT